MECFLMALVWTAGPRASSALLSGSDAQGQGAHKQVFPMDSSPACPAAGWLATSTLMSFHTQYAWNLVPFFPKPVLAPSPVGGLHL